MQTAHKCRQRAGQQQGKSRLWPDGMCDAGMVNPPFRAPPPGLSRIGEVAFQLNLPGSPGDLELLAAEPQPLRVLRQDPQTLISSIDNPEGCALGALQPELDPREIAIATTAAGLPWPLGRGAHGQV